ncbi:hypothetical protein ACWCPQ_15115 [Nocardia sp. NPDC001965]
MIPRTALDEHGTVRDVHLGVPAPNSCSATLDTGGPAPAELHWTLARVPASSAVDETRRVGEVAVEVPAPMGETPPGSSGQCWVTAQFPSTVQVLLSLRADPATDTCALGNALIDVAIAQLPTGPAYGTSPDSVRTVLTGADPCEILPRIGAAPLLPAEDNQLVQNCKFGADTMIEYTYQAVADIDHQETRTFDGRQVFVTHLPEIGHTSYAFAAGPAVTGDIFPVVTVLGRNQPEVESARDALLTRFPAA